MVETRIEEVEDRELFEWIRKELKRLGYQEGDKSFEYAAVLFAAANLGAIPHRLAEVTGYSLNFIIQIENRMRAAGIWVEHRADTSEWYRPRSGFTALLVHGLVAKGMLAVKAGSMPREYFLTPLGHLLAKATSSYNWEKTKGQQGCC